MKIESKFQKKKPVLSFEIFPPKRDKAIQNIDETLAILSELNPDFISVTFGAGGSHTNNQTVELAKRIKQQYGIEQLVHLTCLNHSKFEICELLEELKDSRHRQHPCLARRRKPGSGSKKDFRYASDLVKFIRQYGDFSISGACYPECHTESKNKVEDIAHLKEKVDSGVQHLISQLFFDNNAFYSFQEHIQIAGMHVPVEAGIMPVINKAQIERMVTLCGASLPEKFSRVMHKYEDNKEALFDAGMAYAINQIVDLLAHDVDGIHIYTMNNPIVAKRICDGIKNLI